MLEPKDKAEELIMRFNPMTYTAVHAHKTPYEYQDAIKCAKIAVDEILKEIPMYIGELNPKWKYWNDVKIELENYDK
jgi:hypothetical protein